MNARKISNYGFVGMVGCLVLGVVFLQLQLAIGWVFIVSAIILAFVSMIADAATHYQTTEVQSPDQQHT